MRPKRLALDATTLVFSGVAGAPFPTEGGAGGAVDGVAFDGDGPMDGVASRLRPDRGFGGGA